MSARKYFRFIMTITMFAASAFAGAPKPMDAAEIKLALKKLNTLGSVLYVAAHPDDENTAFLAMMAKGRCYRTGYLAMTRGEGGQNLIGSEQGELMGVIRTQELLAARRIDGAEQFFTRAIDFGFSKTSDETLQKWGKEKILSDVVWVIRKFQPDVIVTRFTPTLGGHGNHTSSAILAQEAFRAAADSTKFPEQLKFVRPWQAKRIVWNVFRFQQSDKPVKPENSVELDLGAYDPLLGKSYTEIAGESRSMHKSQGFGAGQNKGEFVNYFQHVAGDAATSDLFDGVNTTWSRVPGSDSVRVLLQQAYDRFDFQKPSATIPLLVRAYGELGLLPQNEWVEQKRHDVVDAIQACGGLWLDVWASDHSAVPGSDLKATTMFVNRSSYPFSVRSFKMPFVGLDTIVEKKLVANQAVRIPLTVHIPANATLTQPYWLEQHPQGEAYTIGSQEQIGAAENKPALVAEVAINSPDGSFVVDVPVRYRSVDPVEGETYRPIEIIPPVAVNLRADVFVFREPGRKQIEVTLKAGRVNVSGSLRLNTPGGWMVEPAVASFNLASKDDEQVMSFTVMPKDGAMSGLFEAVAVVDGKEYDRGIRTIEYKHIPPETVFPLAEGKLLRIDLKRRGQTIGYIMGAGDDVPEALRQSGYTVMMLTDQELLEGKLTKFDAIVAGVRAYNTRPKLRVVQKRLLEYVAGGGTYVVQYNTPQRGETDNVGPYPLSISRDRVTVEEVPMAFVNPHHPVLNTPNKITQRDFDGWVQERGLYFADKWDSRYDSVLVCNDPGESPKAGSLLVANRGNGVFIYTGLAFFRQLPAGVPGAYRLFVNLVSQRQRGGKEK